MLRNLSAMLAVAATLLHLASAQVSTSCQPLNTTCPPRQALGSTVGFDFTTSGVSPTVWNQTSTPVKFGGEGAEFKVGAKADSPHLQTNFYIFFGRVEVIMKIAPGTGIVSSIVLLSDDLDEVDIEMFGSNKTTVQSNYFGKGNTTTYDRAIYHQVPWAPQDGFHNYTLDWTAQRLEWWFDGILYRTLKYEEAVGGKNYPQTPSQVHISAWAAGDPGSAPDIISWAGGKTNYKEGPFSMWVKSVKVQDYTKGSEYSYGDRSGSWQSIKVKEGESDISKDAAKPVGLKNKFKAMNTTTKIVVVAVSLVVVLGLVGLLAWWCIQSKRKGAREGARADAEWAAQQKQATEYRKLVREDSSYAGSPRSISGQERPRWSEH